MTAVENEEVLDCKSQTMLDTQFQHAKDKSKFRNNGGVMFSAFTTRRGHRSRRTARCPGAQGLSPKVAPLVVQAAPLVLGI